MEISEFVEAEGLVGALRFAREVVHAAARQCPVWALPEGQVGEVFGLARQVQGAAEAVGVLAAREAHGRGLAGCDGLSAVDWLRVQAPGLDPREAPAIAAVAAALTQPRWAALAPKVAAAETPVAQAATIVRFHQDLARVADPEHLESIVDAMVEASDVLTVRELARLAGLGRACLKPPAGLEREEQTRRADPSRRSVRRPGSPTTCCGSTRRRPPSSRPRSTRWPGPDPTSTSAAARRTTRGCRRPAVPTRCWRSSPAESLPPRA